MQSDSMRIFSETEHDRRRSVAFSLRLSNGQGWGIIATGGLKPWVKRFASMIELEASASHEHPKLIFIQKESATEVFRAPICRLEKTIRKSLPRHGWKAYDRIGFRVWSHRDARDVICEITDKEGDAQSVLMMQFSLYPVYQRAQEAGGVLLHAAMIKWNGIGILLAGASGVGKSTCCSRLPRPWQVLCDDEALVVQDDEKRYKVHPLPTWSEYIYHRSWRTWDVQKHLPLSKIFFLEQADTDEVIPIGQGQASVLITQSAMQVWRRGCLSVDRVDEAAFKKKLFENACQLAKVIPAYKLRVSLTGRFWTKMEKVFLSTPNHRCIQLKA